MGETTKIEPQPWPKVVHWRIGKARAGALLDGREHREFPREDGR